MALTNHERLGKGMELLRQGLGPFVEREIQNGIRSGEIAAHALRNLADDPKLTDRPIGEWDAAGLLKAMWEAWNSIFKKTLGFAERSLVSELRDWRNKWAHQAPSPATTPTAPWTPSTACSPPSLRRKPRRYIK
jgi:hypothetical protein